MSRSRSDARWTEHHQGHISSPPPGGGWSHIAVSDTGSILIELTGAVTGKQMDANKAAAWIGKMLNGGNSCSLYALGTGFDANLIKLCGNIAKGHGV